MMILFMESPDLYGNTFFFRHSEIVNVLSSSKKNQFPYMMLR